MKTSDYLKAMPASQAIPMMTSVALANGLNMNNPRHWKKVYQIVDEEIPHRGFVPQMPTGKVK